MGEKERSPEELDQNSQDSDQQTSQNGFIKDSNGKLYLPNNYLLERDKKPSWLLKPRKGGKTIWDWLELLVFPVLIAFVAGIFTSIPFFRQNEILSQGEEAEENRNQQALLIKYLDDISKLVEKGLLTLNDDENSKTQRTIARARTLSVLRALDSDRKGELIQFLSAAKLIEKSKSIIDLNQADLKNANLNSAVLIRVSLESVKLGKASLVRANLSGVDLKNADLENVNLKNARLINADLRNANLENVNLKNASLWFVNLKNADLRNANLRNANLMNAKGLNPAKVKTACNWEKAHFSEEFKQKLDQEPDKKVDCSEWK